MYGLTEKDIICHSEGYKLGIASNHSDVMHWFPKHGKSMESLRIEVGRLLKLQESEQASKYTSTSLYRVQLGAYRVRANAEAMLTKLKAAGFQDAFIKTE